MYKNVIPDLVSFSTKVKEIKGFVMCQNLNFYNAISNKNKFHYTIVLSDDIIPPSDYDFKSEYFIKKNNTWYYDRKIIFFHPLFKYDATERTFYFNKTYFFLPFRVGSTLTAGEHIANMIELDLFLDGYNILRGIAFQKNGKNIGMSGPGFNGKTTLLKKLLKSGCKYIAEDYLVLNLQKKRVYPTCPLMQENIWRNRKINGELRELIKRNDFLDTELNLNRLYLYQNTQNTQYKTKRKKIIDFLLLNSLYFLDNLFTRSYLYEQHLTEKFFNRINELREMDIDYKFLEVYNFNFDLI